MRASRRRKLNGKRHPNGSVVRNGVINLRMQTASFFTYTGPGRISIARWAPSRHPFGYRVYRPLNPRREWMKLAPAEFDPIYRTLLLAQLDPQQVWDDRLAAPHEPVLLCWEHPPYRRHVAEWLEEALGMEVAKRP